MSEGAWHPRVFFVGMSGLLWLILWTKPEMNLGCYMESSISQWYVCYSMTTNYNVFDECLTKIENIIENKQLINCYRQCADLTGYSALANFKDGLLISEILEGVFMQLNNVFDNAEIPESEQKQFLAKLKSNISQIKSTYKEDDKNNLYNALKEIRSTATYFQINCWTTLPNKPKSMRQK